MKRKKLSKWQKNQKYEDWIKKTKHNKFGLKGEIEHNQNLNKRIKKKIRN